MTIPVESSIIIELPSKGSDGWHHRVFNAETGEPIHGVLSMHVRVDGGWKHSLATLTQLVNEEGEPVVQGVSGPDGALRAEFDYMIDHYRLRTVEG